MAGAAWAQNAVAPAASAAAAKPAPHGFSAPNTADSVLAGAERLGSGRLTAWRAAVRSLPGEGAAPMEPLAQPAIVERIQACGGDRAIERMQFGLVLDRVSGSHIAALNGRPGTARPQGLPSARFRARPGPGATPARPTKPVDCAPSAPRVARLNRTGTP